jgi:hypothetical protein
MEPKKFKLPARAATADRYMSKLGEMAITTGWKRGALVAAQVHLAEHGGDRSKTNSGLDGKVSPKEYAAKGIVGMTSPETVRHHCRAYLLAVEAGVATPAALGKEVVIQSAADWDDYYALAKKGGGGGKTGTSTDTLIRRLENATKDDYTELLDRLDDLKSVEDIDRLAVAAWNARELLDWIAEELGIPAAVAV